MNPHQQILAHYGLDKQISQVYMECADLVIALDKWRRSPDDEKPDLRTVAEEIADVQIMLEQMKEAFKCKELVSYIMDEKLERTLKRIQ